jgi:hypothetical protein
MVRGQLGGRSAFRIVRVGQPLIDPVSGESLGIEATDLGIARLDPAIDTGAAPDQAHRFVISHARQEIQAGDRLIPLIPLAVTPELMNERAHSNQTVQAHVVSVYGEGLYAGQHQIVAINRGARDGVGVGQMLALRAADSLTASEKKQGSVWIFRVFERVSYGLIRQTHTPVMVGDRVVAPTKADRHSVLP